MNITSLNNPSIIRNSNISVKYSQNGSQIQSQGINSIFSNDKSNNNSLVDSKLKTLTRNGNNALDLNSANHSEIQKKYSFNVLGLDSLTGDKQKTINSMVLPEDQNRNDISYRKLLNVVGNQFTSNKSKTSKREECVLSTLNSEQGITINSFQHMLKELAIEKKFYTDTCFLQNNQSLGLLQAQQNCSWIRISQLYQKATLFPNNFSLDGLNEGLYQSKNILTIFNYLINNEKLIKRLFNTKKMCPQGIYSIWLFISGTWKNIIVDDYVPVINEGTPKKHAFCSINSMEDNIWILILEKCYAKEFGSYSNLDQASTHEILSTILGAPYSEIQIGKNIQNLSRKSWETDIETYELWKQLTFYFSKQYIVIASKRGSFDLVCFLEESKEQELVSGEKVLLLKFSTHNLSLLQSWFPGIEKSNYFISVDQFRQYFDRVRVLYFQANYCYNSIQLFQDEQQEKILRQQSSTISFFAIRLKIIRETTGFISLWQIDDDKMLDHCLQVSSQAKLLLAKVESDQRLIFISSLELNSKVMAMPFTLQEGIFILMIEVQTNQITHQQLNISINSDLPVSLQIYQTKSKIKRDIIMKQILKDQIFRFGIDLDEQVSGQIFRKGFISGFWVYLLKNQIKNSCLTKNLEIHNSNDFQSLDSVSSGKLRLHLLHEEEIVLVFRRNKINHHQEPLITFEQSFWEMIGDQGKKESEVPTLQDLIRQTNIFEELNKNIERRSNYGSQNSLLSRIHSKQETLQNKGEGEEEELKIPISEKQNNKKEEFPQNSSQRSIDLTILIINSLIIFLALVSSFNRCLNLDILVYVQILIKLTSRENIDSNSIILWLFAALSPIQDIFYIKFYRINSYDIFNQFYTIGSENLVRSITTEYLWIILVILKIIFLLVVINGNVSNRKQSQTVNPSFSGIIRTKIFKVQQFIVFITLKKNKYNENYGEVQTQGIIIRQQSIEDY